MAKYRRVAISDRYQIESLRKSKISIKEIADLLNFNKTTIYRELRRNTSQKNYKAYEAEKSCRERMQRCSPKLKLTDETIVLIRRMMSSGWSAEQISGRLRIENGLRISHETIYKYLRSVDKTELSLRSYQRRPPKKSRGRYLFRKDKPKWHLHIKDRPAAINNRSRYGDWERDTMHAADKGLVLVLVDRKSRYIKLDRVVNRKAITIYDKTNDLLSGLVVRSLTNDNGQEFGDAVLQKVPVYFCTPFKPQQRGTVENTIGLLRQYIKRKTDISTWNQQQFKDLENKLNMRPRKCLGFKTPYEVHFNKKVALTH